MYLKLFFFFFETSIDCLQKQETFDETAITVLIDLVEKDITATSSFHILMSCENTQHCELSFQHYDFGLYMLNLMFLVRNTYKTNKIRK